MQVIGYSSFPVTPKLSSSPPLAGSYHVIPSFLPPPSLSLLIPGGRSRRSTAPGVEGAKVSVPPSPGHSGVRHAPARQFASNSDSAGFFFFFLSREQKKWNIPRPGVEQELELLVYAQDPSLSLQPTLKVTATLDPRPTE